jgi:hypothetical protein
MRIVMNPALPVYTTIAPVGNDAEIEGDNDSITFEEMAAAEFEPWEHHKGGWRVPTNEEWVSFGERVLPTVRIAWVTMYKTKAELENISRELDDDAFIEMGNAIGEARAAFEGFAKVLAGARARIMCASASAGRRLNLLTFNNGPGVAE